MKCSNCGAEIVDGCKFCTVCGSRVDGKIVCPNCNTENLQGSTYCMACGKLLVDKRVCKKCNTELPEDSVFCPNCGERYSKTHVSNDNGGSGKGFCRVEKVITPSLLLIGLFFVFLCSMLMGISIKTDGGILGQMLTLNKNKIGVFYFFGKAYEDLLVYCGITKFSQAYFSELFPVILLTVVFACNIILSLTMLTVGAVKFGIAVYNKRQVNLGKYFAWAFAGFLFSLALLHSFGISLNASYYDNARSSASELQNSTYGIKTVSNAMSLSCIIVSAVVGLGAFTLNTIAECKNRFTVKGLLYRLFALLIAVFLGIALFGFSKNFCRISVNDGHYSVDISLRALFFSVNALNSNLVTGISVEEFQKVAGLIIAIFLVGTVLFSVGFGLSVSTLFGKMRYGLALLILTAVTIILLSGEFVALGVMSEEVYEMLFGDLTLESTRSSISSLVFSVLSFGLADAMVCLKPKTQTE